MQTKVYSALLFLLTINLLSAQTNLQPSIGIGDLPNDTDLVCDIPNYLGNYDVSGLAAGEFSYDFNLYDTNGEPMDLESLLLSGKAVLLVNGSYTCPVFRGKVNLINELAESYGEWVEVLIIYTVEAHPFGDISPYFGFENTGNANLQEGILYAQPTTYGERKAIVNDMLDVLDIQVPVYIDGPCNNWWENFGPAPNNAYLVNTDGSIYSKQGWFNKFPDDIICDLDNLLEIPNNCDFSNNGSFTFELTGDSIVEGIAGQTLYVYGLLKNDSNAGVEIEIKRIQEDVPTGWETSMCLDVCYPTNVDYVTIYLEAGEELPYTMYFYTNETIGDGMVRMGFRNLNAPQNRFVQRMYASTTTTALNEREPIEIHLFPNPTKGLFYISLNKKELLYGPLFLIVYSAHGQVVKRQEVLGSNCQIDVSDLPSGIYEIVLENAAERFSQNKIVLIE